MSRPSKEGAVIQSMFDALAPRYDVMNRVMTFGQDQRWRRFLVRSAGLNEGSRVLDLAAGTGDIALEVKRRFPGATLVAGDFSLGMLARGRCRRGGESIAWIACDALALPFADASFDAVTFGYLLRNVADIDRAIDEIHRVLRPGGCAVCLDTAPPRGLARPFLSAYFRFGLPLLARILARDVRSYNYLVNSTMAFESPPALRERFLSSGFNPVTYRTFMFGAIAIHVATKPKAALV